MIIHDCEQRSLAWHKLRLGIPTASGFDKLIAPKTLKPSASADKYMLQLLAEWLIGEPCDNGNSAFMDRGTNYEDEAISYYETFINDVNVRRVGFCMRDDKKVGCSPDGLINGDGMIEIKTPSAAVHVGYLLASLGYPETAVADVYKCQVQGGLLICERQWCDVFSYNPAMIPVVTRIERDDAFIAAFVPLLEGFIDKLESAKELIKASGDMEQFQKNRLNSIL